jgi:hypothetical protein
VTVAEIDEALTRVLRSEHNHLAQLWDDAPHPQRLLMLALAAEPTAGIYVSEYHERHELPPNPTLQIALAGLIKKEIAGRNDDGDYCIVEPFLDEWVEREQRDYGVAGRLRDSLGTRPGPKRPRQKRRKRPS